MNLVNELENDLALAFLVEKKHSEQLDSTKVTELLDRVRQILQPLSIEDEPTIETEFSIGNSENVRAH